MFRERKPVAKIFINYRRDDTRWVAGRLVDSLRAYFGDDRVFRDIDGIAGGAEFGDVIQHTMKHSDAVIVLIGPDWLSATNDNGERRLDDPKDWVSREIASALQKDVPVYPVLIENTPMPRRDELPDSLKPLVDRNAMSISDLRWDSDVVRMAKTIAIDIPGSAAERTLEWVRLVVSLVLFAAVIITTGMVAWYAGKDGVDGSPDIHDWFNWTRPFDERGALGLLPELWQSSINCLAILGSSIGLLVFARLVDESRRSYVHASALVGILGSLFFFILMLPLKTPFEAIVMFFGSTVTITAMFVLMNLSGFKPR